MGPSVSIIHRLWLVVKRCDGSPEFEVVMLRTNKFPEVFDVHGNLVRLVAVAPGEVTCLRCGETSGGDHCERCGAARGGREKTTMVATVSYLHPDEYRIEQ